MNASSPERTIVGFDIRKGSSLNNLFLTSYDDEVRYEDIYENFREYRSGLNLFYVDPSSIVSLEIPAGARIIAFDLPTDLVLHLSTGDVSNPEPLPQIDINNGEWEFVGFDVVDPMTQTSAFHGFDPPLPIGKTIEGCSSDFNDHGLLEDIESARKVAEYCNNIVPEHSPFSPCGVWLRHPTQVARRRNPEWTSSVQRLNDSAQKNRPRRRPTTIFKREVIFMWTVWIGLILLGLAGAVFGPRLLKLLQ